MCVSTNGIFQSDLVPQIVSEGFCPSTLRYNTDFKMKIVTKIFLSQFCWPFFNFDSYNKHQKLHICRVK